MRLLEIGCGDKRLAPLDGCEWETMQIENHLETYLDGDIVHNLEDLPLPIADNAYDIIYMSHVLEHVSWIKTVDVLKDIRRILKPKGTLEIIVPDLDKLIEAMQSKQMPDKWRRWNKQNYYMNWFNGRLFNYDGNWHKASFNKEHLTKCLIDAGFKDISDMDYCRGYDHGYISLKMKAVK